MSFKKVELNLRPTTYHFLHPHTAASRLSWGTSSSLRSSLPHIVQVRSPSTNLRVQDSLEKFVVFYASNDNPNEPQPEKEGPGPPPW
jgi:hypothetical protein